jgi:glycosyltransferase involved in cell wall biosynthesis
MKAEQLRVLMISSDRNILAPGSAVSERMKEYGAQVQELHIVLMSDTKHGLKEAQISENVWVYPTNSLFNILRPVDAARIGKKLVLEKKFVRGGSLITGDSVESGWAGLKIKKKWRIPLEVQLHTDPFSPYYSGFLNKVRKIMANRVYRNTDSIRVVSETLKSKLSQLTSASINVLPIFIDKEKISNGKISFDLRARYGWSFIILMAARLTKEKNFPLALKILSSVRETYPDTGLVIVGSGVEENNLKNLAERLGLKNNVVFAGWQNDLYTYYHTANMFLQTSNFEGYGLALIEAGLSSLPVVTTRVGIARELKNGEDAYIFPVGEEQAFVEAIKDLIENNKNRERLRINLKRTLEEKLLSKDEYIGRMVGNWEETAKKVK